MKYKMTELTEELSIHKIISIHYFEYRNDFSFDGESHNFWELLCVDKGEVKVAAGHESLTLSRGRIIFHQPNEFHRVEANGITAPNLVVIGFECQSPCMSFFRERILSVDEEEQGLLAGIISEARQCFEGRLDDPYQEQLVRKASAPFAGEQMIKLHLEQFLIVLYRRAHMVQSQGVKRTSPPGDSASGRAAFHIILNYFQENLCKQLTISQICRDNLLSASQLKKLFLEMADSGVIEYFNRMKIDEAKELIRCRRLNFTQIAGHLGYTSVHYFSRQFKRLTGMTPSEYATSIKKLSEKKFRREEGP